MLGTNSRTMLCQRSSRSFATLFKPSRILCAARKPHSTPSIRTYSSLPSLRPTIFASTIRRTAVLSTASLPPAQATTTSTTGSALDLLPKISSHPALGSIQVRGGPRDTFSPSHFVRKRRHGFLSRQKTRKGRATLVRRKLKRRSTLSH